MKSRNPGSTLVCICLVSLALVAIFGPQVKNLIHSTERDPGDRSETPTWLELEKVLYPAHKFVKDRYSTITDQGTFKEIPDDDQVYSEFPMAESFGEDVWYEVKGRLLDDLGTYLVRDVALDKTLLVEDSMYRQIKKDGGSLAGIGLPEAGTYIRVRHTTVDFGVNDKRSSPMISNFYESDPNYREIVKAVEAGGGGDYPVTKNKARILRP